MLVKERGGKSYSDDARFRADREKYQSAKAITSPTKVVKNAEKIQGCGEEEKGVEERRVTSRSERSRRDWGTGNKEGSKNQKSGGEYQFTESHSTNHETPPTFL